MPVGSVSPPLALSQATLVDGPVGGDGVDGVSGAVLVLALELPHCAATASIAQQRMLRRTRALAKLFVFMFHLRRLCAASFRPVTAVGSEDHRISGGVAAAYRTKSIRPDRGFILTSKMGGVILSSWKPRSMRIAWPNKPPTS